MKNKIVISVVCCLILLLVIGFMFQKEYMTEVGLFSWYSDQIVDMDFSLMKKGHITEVYQMFHKDTRDEDVVNLLKDASEQGIAVYALSGEPEWALDADAADIISETERVKRFNTLVDDSEKIKGIVLDIEPYSLADWEVNQQTIMQSYSEALKNCKAALGADLELLICIPSYYDDMGYSDFLDLWIREYCDGFLVMNYSVGQEADNIEHEVALCSQYQKKIKSIYELQPALSNGVEKSNTYYELGISEARQNFKELKKRYPYRNLGMAYHEYVFFGELAGNM